MNDTGTKITTSEKVVASTASPMSRVASRAARARIDAALAQLPPPQRDAFLLHIESGLSLADIAAMTGAGEETVKSRVRYAYAKLRSALGDLA